MCRIYCITPERGSLSGVYLNLFYQSCCGIAGKMRRRAGEALLILPERGLSPKGQLTPLEGGKIPTILCLAPGQRPQGAGPWWPPLPLQHHPTSSPLPPQGQGYSLTPGAPTSPPLPIPLPLLHCHLSHTGKCLTLFDGCGFPRRQ